MPTGEGPCLLGSIVLGNTPWGRALSHWETLLTSLEELPACLALSLAKYLTAWGGKGLCLETTILQGRGGKLPWESLLSAGERVFSSGEAWELPAWESALSERVLSSGEAWELPAWELPAWELPALGEHTACQSAVCLGSLWTACLGECTPCQRRGDIYWGSLGTACPWRVHSLPEKECYLLGKPGNCLPGRVHSLPRKECCLPEKPGT